MKDQLVYINSFEGLNSYQSLIESSGLIENTTLLLMAGEVQGIQNIKRSIGFNNIDDLFIDNRINPIVFVTTPVKDFCSTLSDLRRLESYGLEIKILSPFKAPLGTRGIEFGAKSFQTSDIITYPDFKQLTSSDKYKGQNVLVTGAGGSIGSELSLKLATLECNNLILLDHSEKSIFHLKDRMDNVHKKSTAKFYVADIRDRLRIEQLLIEFEINIVFHLAAYKHVTLMEEDTYAAFKVNVMGTKTLFDISIKCNVEQFNFISTDKAVNPVGVMGLTKKLAELYILDHEQINMKVNVLRFPNVLGSSGSVTESFKNAIDKGSSLIVTDKRMHRYFVLVQDLITFIINGSNLARHRDTLVFNIETPSSIVKLAEAMIDMYSRQNKPNSNIQFTEKQPFEKLDEDLFNKEEKVISTEFPQVKIARCKPRKININKHIEDINQLLKTSKKLTFQDLMLAVKIKQLV